MALTITHAKVTSGATDDSVEVDLGDWNDNHTIAGTIAASEVTSGAALTNVDDTNVTLTLGGAPTTALLAATSITVSWTGTLAAARLNANVVQAITNDTNVTGSIAAQNLTIGWTGNLAVSRGGTAITSYTQGDIIYSSASNTLSKLAKDANATRYLSNTGASNNPAWAQVNLANGVSGNLPVGNLNSGTSASSSTFWRGDGTWATPAGSTASYSAPQGRLTLATGVPVMALTQSGKTTLYYTPYVGDLVPIYDGSAMTPTAFSEISVATTDTTKNPAAIGANKVNDWFVWNDGGTMRLSHGPDWTDDTTRSAGTALVMVNGIYLNSVAITNGPGASRGTYVGTTRSNASSQLDHKFGSLAADGGEGWFGVWNAYNRVYATTMVRTSTDSWTYNVVAWRAPNGSSTYRVYMVRGINEDCVQATYNSYMLAGAASGVGAGVGVDSTTAFSGTTALNGSSSVSQTGNGMYSGLPGLGFHWITALEYTTTTTAGTFYGDLGVAYVQTGLHVALMY